MAKSFKKERFKLKTDILTGSSTLDAWKRLYLNDGSAAGEGKFVDPEDIIDEYIKAVDESKIIDLDRERSVPDVQSPQQSSQVESSEERAKLPFQRHYTDILKSDTTPRCEIMETDKNVSISTLARFYNLRISCGMGTREQPKNGFKAN